MNNLEQMQMEEKTFPFEIKELTEEGQFEGYAAIFGKPDKLGETIEKGAFTKTLKEKDFFPMCWYHDPRNPIGIAYLIEDAKGLKVKGELNLDVQLAKEKYSLMKQKAIRGLSFGYRTVKDSWDGAKRFLKEINLFEVSPCTFPMHPKALIGAVKQEGTPDQFKNALEVITEYKSGEPISAANEKLINAAIEALTALKSPKPSDDTQDKKSFRSPIIEALETENKPQSHLFNSAIEALEIQKEKK